MNKYKNMETIEIRKRLEVLQKIYQSQRSEEENKELTSLSKIYGSRVLTSITESTFKQESGDKEEKEGKDYVVDDVGAIDFG